MTEVRRLDIEFSNRDLWRIALPLVIERLLGTTVGMVDSMMVAQVGEAAVSAISLVHEVNSLLLTMFAGIIPSRSAAKKDPVVALRTE